jgi:hypothetical protein
MDLFKKFLLILSIPFVVCADKVILPTEETEPLETPWLTGPLLAPSGMTVPQGHILFEPYVYILANRANYDEDWHAVKLSAPFWNNYFQPQIQVGATPWLDVQILPTVFYNYTDGSAKWALGDTPIGVDIQLFQKGKDPTDWITGIKLVLKETLPIGKYRNLNPDKQGTDIGGSGSWATSVGIVWGQLIHIKKLHFFDTRLSVQYTIPAPVHVKGFNTYGGGFGTDGTIYPPQNLQIDLGMEFTLTKNWVLAMDILGSWSTPARFKGKVGVGTDNLPAFDSFGSAAQFSLAPAIEYNWNENIGLIAGSWFSVAGRNSIQFASGIIAFSYYR